MSDPAEPNLVIDVAAWSAKARANPAAYESRQLTEVFLTALSFAPSFREQLYLKGGILMALAYGSPRSTSDVDLTAIADPAETAAALRQELDRALQRATAALGLPDLLCRVQTAKPRPRPETFEDAQNPSLRLTIAAARRGSAEAAQLEAGSASRVLRVDITFKEPVGSFQILGIGSGERRIRAYSLTDLVAEKLRALLQQPVRDRYRRQDVYDIVLLVRRFDFDADERAAILRVLRDKARPARFRSFAQAWPIRKWLPGRAPTGRRWPRNWTGHCRILTSGSGSFAISMKISPGNPTKHPFVDTHSRAGGSFPPASREPPP